MGPEKLRPAKPRPKKFGQIGSVTAEIFLIWTNVAWTNITGTNVAWTNVTAIVEISSR